MKRSRISTAQVFPWIRRSRLSMLFVILLLPTIPLMGCYGQFALTKSLYQFNGDVSDNGVIQSLVLWVLGGLFIYSIAIAVDFIILNLIEFWSGENPMMAKTFNSPDGSQVVMTPTENGKEVRVDVMRDGKTVDTRRVVKMGDSHFEVLNAGGETVGKVDKKQDGNLELSRPGTEEKAVLTHQMIEQYRAQPASSM
jgi:hypothetical protein